MTYDLSREQIQRIRRARDAGLSWHELGLQLGLSADVVRRRCDPTWADKRREQINGRRSDVRVAQVRERGETRDPEYDPRRDGAVHHISLTAELLGDPLPGRSALDRKRAAANGGSRGGATAG